MPARKKIKSAPQETHRPPTYLPRCRESGGKLCFPTEQAAGLELIECRIKFMFHNKRRRKEARSYLCDHCESFHLTAMSVPPQHVSDAHGMETQMNKDMNRRRPLRPAASPPPRRTDGSSSSGGGQDYESGFSSDWGSDSPSFSADWGSGSSSSSDSSGSCVSSGSDSSSSCDSGGGGE